jgi:rod shape-determining protein MreD
MMTRTTAFWTFIGVLVLLHLMLRLGAGLTFIPDLLVVAALLGSRRLGGAMAAGYGLVLGLLADSLSMIAFGATAVAFVIVCYLGARSRNLFEGDSFLFIICYVFLGAWLVEAIRFAIGAAVQRGATPLPLFTSAPLAALYTGVAAFTALLAYRAATGNR